jgi:hypothetical protein
MLVLDLFGSQLSGVGGATSRGIEGDVDRDRVEESVATPRRVSEAY